MTTIQQHLAEFWKYFRTPFGFFLTLYILNVIGWGAMLFFLLLGVAPTMSHTERLEWIEIVSQIMNSFFCVAAFVPATWRFRDLHYLFKWRAVGDVSALHSLANIHQSWFRVNLTEDVIHEVAPETEKWRLDFVIYTLVLNTLNQVVLCYFMWGYGPSNRPIWAVALFVVLGCTFGIIASKFGVKIFDIVHNFLNDFVCIFQQA